MVNNDSIDFHRNETNFQHDVLEELELQMIDKNKTFFVFRILFDIPRWIRVFLNRNVTYTIRLNGCYMIII